MVLHELRQPIAKLEKACKVGQNSAEYPIFDRGLSLLPLLCSGLSLTFITGLQNHFSFATSAIGLGLYGSSQSLCTYLKEKIVPSIETGWLKSVTKTGLSVLDFLNDQMLLATLQSVAPSMEGNNTSHFFSAINTATFFDTLPALIKNFEKDLTIAIQGREPKYEINGLKICQSSLITALATFCNENLQPALQPVMPTVIDNNHNIPKADPFLSGLAEPAGYAFLETFFKILLTNEKFEKGSLKQEFFNGFVDQSARTIAKHVVGPAGTDLFPNVHNFTAVSALKKLIHYVSNDFALDSCTLPSEEEILLSQNIEAIAVDIV
jgi:hypothetical protein